jgi:hypothetical protein
MSKSASESIALVTPHVGQGMLNNQIKGHFIPQNTIAKTIMHIKNKYKICIAIIFLILLKAKASIR